MECLYVLSTQLGFVSDQNWAKIIDLMEARFQPSSSSSIL